MWLAKVMAGVVVVAWILPLTGGTGVVVAVVLVGASVVVRRVL